MRSCARVPEGSFAAPYRAKFLVEALPYIRALRGKTVVVRYDGHARTQQAIKEGFARDITLLHLVGMNPVVVHEGGAKLGREIAELISRHGGTAAGLGGREGCVIHVQTSGLPSAEAWNQGPLARPGNIERIDPDLVNLVQDSGCIPVVMPVGTGRRDEIFDLDADDVAAEMAVALKAETLVLMTNAPGIVDREGTLLSSVSVAGIEELFDDGAVCGSWQRKLARALRAVKNGVSSAHVINGRVPSALLLEMLTADRLGTMIVSEHAMHHVLERSAPASSLSIPADAACRR